MESRLKKKLLIITLITFAVPFIILSSTFTVYFFSIAYLQDGQLFLYDLPIINVIWDKYSTNSIVNCRLNLLYHSTKKVFKRRGNHNKFPR